MRRWRLISFGRLSGVQVLGCSGALLLVAAVAAQNRGPVFERALVREEGRCLRP